MTPVLLLALLALQNQTTVLPRPPKTPSPPSAYEQLIARYQSGDYEGAVAMVARNPGKVFEQPFDLALAKVAYRAQDEKLLYVQRKVVLRGNDAKFHPDGWWQAQDDVIRFLLAAMMLHTEASLRTPLDDMQAQLRVARTADKALMDAERELEPHAWNKVKFERPPDGAPFLTKPDVERARHDWIVLEALGYHARSVIAGLRTFIEGALERYPRDPPLELCLGVYEERVARFTVVDESLIHQIYPPDDVARWRHRLESALDAYLQAARAPDLAAEAHLRMGRIRAQLNDLKRAREELEPLAASGEPMFIKYLALLVLGEVEIADRHPEAAAERYRAAFALFPTSQAPLLAMSRLSDQRGDMAGAREWLDKSLSLTVNRRVDPWWLYFAPFVNMNTLIGQLRLLAKR
jgi:tetratricopeptide (TPR) repeat protein